MRDLQSLFFDGVILSIYRWMVMPLAVPASVLAALFGHKKIRAGLKMRWPQNGRHPILDLPKHKNPIWFHCASGEFEYAKPVIRELKLKHPEQKVLVTYFSPSYKKQIESDKNVDYSCPLPWDFPGSISSFLDHHRPKCLLIARTDLWPELIHQTQRAEIPSLLFSATRNHHRKNLATSLQSWLWKKLNLIYAVADEDRENFLEYGIPVVHAKGDTRFDQVFDRLDNPRHFKKELFSGGSNIPTLLCGSTWAEDERQLLPAIKNLVQSQQLRLVLAPHEVDDTHLQNLLVQIQKLGLTAQSYSQTQTWDSKSVLIVDTVGVLAELYTIADIAFVGGSFKSTVHSVMEPLAAGCPVFVGPLYKNNREAIEFSKTTLELTGTNIVTETKDQKEIEVLLKEVLPTLADLETKTNLKRMIRSKAFECKGASQSVVEWIEQQL